ncbi:MAG: hypothetical protein Q8941_12430 [Bacteroidota bacterium]|nr:hypothetical protein [Bacteroidota bacterium]
MTAKKMLRIASFVMLIAIAVPASAGSIVPVSAYANSASKTEDPRAQQLLQRLQEIKAMNKSELTRTEKKDLRKEVKEIRKEMKSTSKGVYLSVGAIIIIILLLILIL